MPGRKFLPMFTIETSEIKTFLNVAKGVKSHTVLPVLSCVLFDGNALVKTNLETYYRRETKSEGEAVAVLLDEQKLNSFVAPGNLGGADRIEITVKEKAVTLSVNGGKKPLTFGRIDVTGFPLFPEQGGEPVLLDGPFLRIISGARVFIEQSEVPTNFCYVHLTGEGIYASNRNSFYHYAGAPDVPGLLLSKEAAGIVGGFAVLECSKAGNYMFFKDKGETFAFIKTEQSTPLEQFRIVIGGCTQNDWFEFYRAEVLQFCDLVAQVCPSLQATNPVTLPDCTLEVKNSTLYLKAVDNVYSVDLQHECGVLGKYSVEPFKFNPKLFSLYLKGLPFETVRFSPYARPGFFSVWTVEDDNFKGILSQLINQ